MRSTVMTMLMLTATMSVQAGAWFEGGTLHRATLLDWVIAGKSDRLATTADYLIATGASPEVRTSHDLAVLRERSEAVSSCITEMSGRMDANRKASEALAPCLIRHGWMPR